MSDAKEYTFAPASPGSKTIPSKTSACIVQEAEQVPGVYLLSVYGNKNALRSVILKQ
jgi:hypothetical protein